MTRLLPAFIVAFIFALAVPPVAAAAPVNVYPLPAPVKNWLIERFDAPPAHETTGNADEADIKPLLRFMQGYYLHPERNEVPEFLRLVDRTKLLERQPRIFPLLSGFLCRLASLNDENIPGWLEGKTYGAKTQALLQYAIWRAGHLNDPDIAKFFTEKPLYLSTTPGSLSAIPLRTPEDADMMWGGFLATGDAFYINKLIDSLNPVASEMSDAARDLLSATVAATLKANALDHEIVLRTLKKRMDSPGASEKLKQQIAALLPQDPPGIRFPVHDGAFGAALVSSDLDDIMAQVTKKADEPLAFPIKKSVMRGEKIGFLIVYSGMALSDTLHADLDFDMTLTAPDGTVLQGGSLKRHPAYAGKLASSMDILHTPSFMGVEFTPEDAPGIYHLDATLRDNISGRALPLHLSLDLLDKEAATPAQKPAASGPPSGAYGNLNR
jgi:hypothetical protein